MIIYRHLLHSIQHIASDQRAEHCKPLSWARPAGSICPALKRILSHDRTAWTRSDLPASPHVLCAHISFPKIATATRLRHGSTRSGAEAEAGGKARRPSGHGCICRGPRCGRRHSVLSKYTCERFGKSQFASRGEEVLNSAEQEPDARALRQPDVRHAHGRCSLHLIATSSERDAAEIPWFIFAPASMPVRNLAK